MSVFFIIQPTMFAHRHRYLFVLLLATYSFFNILFTSGDSLFQFPIDRTYLYAIIVLMVLFLWESNRLLFKLLQQSQIRFHKRFNILIAFFLLSLLAVGIIGTATAYLVPRWISAEPVNDATQFRLSLAFCFRINLFLHTVHAIIYYNSRLKDTMLETERLKTLSAESQFEALRNQVKPHFLFNSFNVLTGLVHRDPGLASEFIQQLSRVYRYLLYHQQDKLVSLDTEMDFMDSYIFLLRIRFGDALEVKNMIEEVSREKYMTPPASVQIMIENAVKHNKVSKKDRLSINIFEENGFLIIRNNIQRKTQDDSSLGMGLKNINMRYQYLTHQEVIIEEGQRYFTVRLPLILAPEYENTHRRG